MDSSSGLPIFEQASFFDLFSFIYFFSLHRSACTHTRNIIITVVIRLNLSKLKMSKMLNFI